MSALKTKLKYYGEYCYLIFIFIMSCCAGLGFSSSEVRYLVLFFISSAFLLIKLVSTDYTKRELVWMISLTIAVGLVFLVNRQKTLIITLMAVCGTKNVNLIKIFKVMFYSRFVCTIAVLLFILIGVIPNTSFELPKAGELITVYSYGYGHPNTFFINIFILVLLLIMIYKEKLKWYLYIILTAALFVAHKLVMSRTGWYLYLLLCVLLLLYHVIKKKSYKKYITKMFICLPVGICLISFFVPFMYKNQNSFAIWLNQFVTGRIFLMSEAFSNIPFSLFGYKDVYILDNAYMNLMLNYGVVCLVLYVCFITFTMVALRKRNCEYELIIMGVTALFAFMEVAPLHVFWSPCLLYMSILLFRPNGAAE